MQIFTPLKWPKCFYGCGFRKKTEQNEWRHIVYKFSFSIWEIGAVRFKSWPHLRARSTDTFLLQSPPASATSQGFHEHVSLHHTNMSEPSILDRYQSEMKYFEYFPLHSVLFSLWEHLCYQWWTDCCPPHFLLFIWPHASALRMRELMKQTDLFSMPILPIVSTLAHPWTLSHLSSTLTHLFPCSLIAVFRLRSLQFDQWSVYVLRFES